MPISMPLTLVIAWVLFFGFINTHQRHANSFKGESQSYLLALHASVLLGTLVGLGLLIYYFIQVAWYWPFALFFLGSLAGGILFGTLDAKINPLILSIVGFIAWPLAALWGFYVISNLQP
jgi:hypothetical protein